MKEKMKTFLTVLIYSVKYGVLLFLFCLMIYVGFMFLEKPNQTKYVITNDEQVEYFLKNSFKRNDIKVLEVDYKKTKEDKDKEIKYLYNPIIESDQETSGINSFSKIELSAPTYLKNKNNALYQAEIPRELTAEEEAYNHSLELYKTKQEEQNKKADEILSDKKAGSTFFETENEELFKELKTMVEKSSRAVYISNNKEYIFEKGALDTELKITSITDVSNVSKKVDDISSSIEQKKIKAKKKKIPNEFQESPELDKDFKIYYSLPYRKMILESIQKEFYKNDFSFVGKKNEELESLDILLRDFNKNLNKKHKKLLFLGSPKSAPIFEGISGLKIYSLMDSKTGEENNTNLNNLIKFAKEEKIKKILIDETTSDFVKDEIKSALGDDVEFYSLDTNSTVFDKDSFKKVFLHNLQMIKKSLF